jgi:NarL family two-component system response regulator LiaR
MRILITGRRADLRLALKAFLHIQPDLDVVAEATDAETLLTQAEATQPDVIVLDGDLCDRPLEEFIPTLHQLDLQPRVVLLDSRPESKQAALAAGADAFVVKGTPPKSLLIAIESVRLKREG